MKACWNCKTENEEGVQFCIRCQQPLSGPPIQSIVVRPLKDRSVATILEILPALFGIFGIGHIYAGNPNAGVAWLIGGFVFLFFAVIVDLASLGLGCLVTIPIQLVLIALSVSDLSAYVKKKTDLFGP